MKNFITAEKAKGLREIYLSEVLRKRPVGARVHRRNPREEGAREGNSSDSVYEVI